MHVRRSQRSQRSQRRRLAAFAIAALFLVAACNNDGDDQGLDANDPQTTLAPDGSNGNGQGDQPNTSTTRPPNGGTTPTSGRGSNGTTPTSQNTTGQTPTTRADQAYIGARHGAGGYARTILRPQPAANVVLEVMHQAGAAPVQSSITHAVNVMREVTGKNVTLSGPYQIPGAASAPTEAEIEAMSDRHARTQQGNGTAALRLLFLKGAYEGDDSVLGVAVRGDTAAIMSDQVAASASPFASSSRIEDAVTIHEIGHLLGLVDIVLKTGRQDPEHPNHSGNRESVMYWAVESDVVSQVLGGPPPVNFDSADRADLAAIRNGA